MVCVIWVNRSSFGSDHLAHRTLGLSAAGYYLVGGLSITVYAKAVEFYENISDIGPLVDVACVGVADVESCCARGGSDLD